MSSGATVTFAHHSLIQGNRKGAINGLIVTIILALVFTGLPRFRIFQRAIFYQRWCFWFRLF
ncbi:cytochrome c oxidase subunit 3, partial (mitochondrion) [Neolecta irregularis DAH-3]